MDDVIGFILELDKLKGVTRKVKPLGLDRYENPAEHSWQMALAATALQPYAAEPVDISRVISLLLVHDVGEIDTGDVMAFVETGLSERKAAERQAVERIFGVLPRGQAWTLIALWDEFEAEETEGQGAPRPAWPRYGSRDRGSPAGSVRPPARPRGRG